ncbi:MAG TPA: hypothetical protein DEA94_11325 [Rhodobacteraceae bacterium]|nr:hypothetical protein [Paracoccaceae bacterium]
MVRAIAPTYLIKQVLPESLRHRHTQAVGRHCGRSPVEAHLAALISSSMVSVQVQVQARSERAKVM